MSADGRAPALMRACLEGLSVGDAFGDQFFLHTNRHLTARDLPPPPWEWSDDTEMACSVVTCLRRHGHVDQDALATSFATRMDAGRRYGAGAGALLERIRGGHPWRAAVAGSFGGGGSYGNGAAMRVAPLGAYFAGDPARAAAEAARQAEITHTHPEGIAGAIAVAVAASLAAAGTTAGTTTGTTTGTAEDIIEAVLDHTPGTYVRPGLGRVRRLKKATPEQAAQVLGNGSRVTAQDTVPFALWAATRHLEDYPAGVRACVVAGGDMDTTAAIAGGVIAAGTGTDGIPAEWLAAREPLPGWLEA
ncbi:ADP-ribosylglycohydrolase family protein [Nonomuraea gerenzanensis]|uniref:N-formylglutamate deformylase n=1 Tax=Nonomuraea gerenzanensis TaxID=93944 RepID=A0A1M4ECN9_9ACTN|nr:ADP-ribosylglycohydrolase family protein [Nonomuraea gerenzanensis]UBU18685.1 ADP-ribosylglycohydrolase family protein [Nonomuraea gerenzanensis]SBO96544.1 N-formylglutamate deformylase [Nonomuraea gerenzanensis]